jgi:hypothetical protein
VQFRIGYLSAKFDVIVMEEAPLPVVLGGSFFWIYDLDMRGRDKSLSMLVPKGRAIWALMPPDKRERYPEARLTPDLVQMRQVFTDEGATEGDYRFPTKNFSIRCESAAKSS